MCVLPVINFAARIKRASDALPQTFEIVSDLFQRALIPLAHMKMDEHHLVLATPELLKLALVFRPFNSSPFTDTLPIVNHQPPNAVIRS